MARRKAIEREHDFTLVITGITELIPEAEDALFEAGCDDATLSVRHGRVFLTFSRTATSMKDAILSAIRDVRKADVGADVLRVDICDLVTQAEIARRIGRSRQLVHQYLTGARGPGGFPAPACDLDEGTPLWSWCEMADWFWRNDMIKEDTLRESNEVAAINAVLELEHRRRRDRALLAEITRSLAGPRKRSSA
jgi:hypothetical protein